MRTCCICTEMHVPITASLLCHFTEPGPWNNRLWSIFVVLLEFAYVLTCRREEILVARFWIIVNPSAWLQ